MLGCITYVRDNANSSFGPQMLAGLLVSWILGILLRFPESYFHHHVRHRRSENSHVLMPPTLNQGGLFPGSLIR